jgi:hypothetical protein
MKITKDEILSNLLGIICFLLMIIIGVYAFVSRFQDNKLLKKNGKYTIAATIGTTERTGGKHIEFEYFYLNKRGYGKEGYRKSIIKKNGRYLVLFYPDDLSNNKIFWDKPIPEGIIAPPEGWDTIPKFLEELFQQKEIENK